MVSVARPIGFLPAIRGYLRGALYHFGKELCWYVIAEPIRCLMLSIELEFTGLFRESMIHLVGSTNMRVDGSPDISLRCPMWVNNLFRRKFHQLHAFRREVNEQLHMSTIIIDKQHSIAFSGVDETTLSTWLAVQIWKDWFSLKLTESQHDALKTGRLYRTLLEGGEAYLKAEDVKDALDKLNIPYVGEIEELKYDLDLMKGFAQKKAGEICKNESIVDLEDAGVEYLTCVAIPLEAVAWYGQDA
jgi:hypothetical protein